MENEAFKAKYGFDKPAQDQSIVTHCKMGGRAAKGMDALKELGYQNAQVYPGSMNDWKANGGDIENK